MSLASFANIFWGVLVMVAQILSVALIIAHVSPRFRESSFGRFFKERGLLVAFVVSFLATAGSLIYSDVIGYAPCKLCWFQRICMYPQVILMGVAYFRKESFMKLYGLILSIFGAAIALYHYIGQLGLTPLPCSAVGISVSCSERFVMEFGYITIPMMAFAAFVLIALTLSLSFRKTWTPSL